MTDNIESNEFSIVSNWDRSFVPAGNDSERNLLIEIKAPGVKATESKRRPMNIALVIDRSGSMQGRPLEAARMAAREVVEALAETDRLSIVIFDDEVETLVEASAMDSEGKLQATRQIERISSGGTTDLSAGWFEGARCVAGSIKLMKSADHRVIVLSDGHANRGIHDPEELHQHASELAKRGVKTSAVGIGSGYSPLQLDALVEGGQGRLHDAGSGNDIIEVVTGELLELKSMSALDVAVAIECPVGVTIETMNRSRIERSHGIQSIRLGDLVASGTRSLAVRASIPAMEVGVQLPFKITVDWTDIREAPQKKRKAIHSVIEVVPVEKAASEEVDKEMLSKIALIWETGLVYQSTILNERHDFVGAGHVFEANQMYFKDLVSSLEDSEDRLNRFRLAGERVKQRWDGRSKRQVMTRSKKSMLMEKDHRRDGDKSWDDFLE